MNNCRPGHDAHVYRTRGRPAYRQSSSSRERSRAGETRMPEYCR